MNCRAKEEAIMNRWIYGEEISKSKGSVKRKNEGVGKSLIQRDSLKIFLFKCER
jgi:hypothetical protein